MLDQTAKLEPSRRRINWVNVSTVLSAAILIAAEVFGAAFAGGWAFGNLFGLGDYGTYILQVLFFVLGIVIMGAFIRAGMRNARSTRSSSRKGTRHSRDVAIVIRSVRKRRSSGSCVSRSTRAMRSIGSPSGTTANAAASGSTTRATGSRSSAAAASELKTCMIAR